MLIQPVLNFFSKFAIVSSWKAITEKFDVFVLYFAFLCAPRINFMGHVQVCTKRFQHVEKPEVISHFKAHKNKSLLCKDLKKQLFHHSVNLGDLCGNTFG